MKNCLDVRVVFKDETIIFISRGIPDPCDSPHDTIRIIHKEPPNTAPLHTTYNVHHNQPSSPPAQTEKFVTLQQNLHSEYLNVKNRNFKMSESEAQEAEKRAVAYQELLDLMRDPDEDIIAEVERVLPSYLADPSTKCQGIALSISDLYIKSGYDDIDYDRTVMLLIKHCLNGPQTIADTAASEIETCLKNSTESVINVLFQDLAVKPTTVVIKIIAILVSYMANLTAKDAHVVNMIKMRLEPLAIHPDYEEPVHKEAASAIAAAKIVLGNDLDTVMSPKRAEKKAAVERWIQLVESRNWKDRKVGYEELLDHLSEDSDLKLIEKHFLIQAGVEKYTLCEVLVAQIIDKMAVTFKGQLLRKLREYTNPIINLLKSKRQSRMQTFQKALDSSVEFSVRKQYS